MTQQVMLQIQLTRFVFLFKLNNSLTQKGIISQVFNDPSGKVQCVQL